MNPSVDLDSPDALRIREGGGCLGVFGLPFLGAGVFLALVTVGVVPLSNASTVPFYTWPLLALMGAAFTGVGGWLALGRSWITIDRVERRVRRQWGLLVPMREELLPCHDATVVSLGLIPGDSDSADRFPVALTRPGGADLRLASFTDYGKARDCARAVAEHLELDLEDASSDHTTRLRPSEAALSFQERQRVRAPGTQAVPAPPNPWCQVHRDAGETVIVIPARRPHIVALLAGLAPVAVLAFVGPPLSEFFDRTHTPPPVGWIFLGFMTLVLGVLPLVSVVNAFRRAVRGATIVTVSRARGLRIQQRGAWRTHTTAAIDAADVLDVDFSVRESALAAARRATEQEVQRLRQDASTPVSPRVERILRALGRFATAKGVIVKGRRGIETFGQGLADEEVRYLADVVTRALVV